MISLDDYVKNILTVSRPSFELSDPLQRDIALEGCITGYVRMALLYWPAERVATLLRDLAGTIDHR